VLDEFLARSELDALVAWVVSREQEFGNSRVLGEGDGRIDPDSRRSKVLYAPGPLRLVVEQRLMSVLDYVRASTGVTAFPVQHIEMQVTASNDGDYFRPHLDNAHTQVSTRRLTFVLFFHREPARFSGGRLRFYAQRDGRPGRQIAEVVPRQNQVVFFAPHLYHEIETVSCPSGQFLDSRFTLNGWYHAPEHTGALR
jgi:Rps23 Pro-64 3,4-dihydroxylase Tpa1-like proline 4-hydroxylase